MTKVKTVSPGVVAFWCPGCNDSHALNVGPGLSPSWTYNGVPDSPTFGPSVALTSGHYSSRHQGECWCDYNREHPEDATICHSFVVDGRIQFLSDCTHALTGQTVDLPDYPPTTV